MLINGIDIKKFKCKLLARNINSSVTPYSKGELKYKPMSFTLDLICSNANEVEIMKSNLISKLTESDEIIIKFDDIDCYYRGTVDGTPTTNYIMVGNETLDVSMLVIAEKDEITEVINRITSKTITVPGNLKTPCVVEITPTIDIIDVTLEGLADDPIIIRNLKGGKTVILDGELQKVTVDGINKYGDTDMWDFPSLKPGANIFKFSRNNCDIKIKYKPRWI